MTACGTRNGYKVHRHQGEYAQLMAAETAKEVA